jgi:hypothetical protein
MPRTKSQNNTLLIALIGAVTVATMQNCSQVNFNDSAEQALKGNVRFKEKPRPPW